MVKKKETIDRGLMIILNLLLTVMVSMVGWGGKQVIQNQKESIETINELRVVLSSHNERINNVEKMLEYHDDQIKENEEGIKILDKRVNKLEYKK